VSGLKVDKVDKKQTYTKTEACVLYSGVFWIFQPNVIKIDPYNFELDRFKVDAFFETQCIYGGRWICWTWKWRTKSNGWGLENAGPGKWHICHLVTWKL